MGAAVKDAISMPPHQKLDSYAGMAAQRSTTTQKDMGMAAQRTTTQKDMGRGATAGWVKCPLCPPRRMKRYARGRGLTAHLEAVHGSASLQEKTSAIARAEAAPRTADRRGDGFTSTNEPPLACRLARDGDAVALIELLEATKGPLDPRHRDAHGYRPHHWAAGSKHGCLEALLELMPARRVDAMTRCERIDRKRGGRKDRSSLTWLWIVMGAGLIVAIAMMSGTAGFIFGRDAKAPTTPASRSTPAAGLDDDIFMDLMKKQILLWMIQ